MKATLLSFLIFITAAGFSSVQEDYDAGKLAGLSRSNNIPEESLKGASDPYFEGYIQALVDMHYYEYQIIVLVKDHTVWLANLSKNQVIAKSIIAFVKDVPGVEDVKVLNGLPPKEVVKREKYVNRPQIRGIWFPQTTELYQPMIASPRYVGYTFGYRGGDKAIGRHTAYVSLGDDFPFFRWLDVTRWHGDLQIGIEACMWAVFNVDVPAPNINGGTALTNSDFYVGIPLSFAADNWSFRLRVYHISSHLGDEFLVNHPTFVQVNVNPNDPKRVRVNPSYEAVDFFTSYQAWDFWRLYIGPGYILHSDQSFNMQHFYIEYGTEVRFFGKKFYYHRLYGNCVVAANFRNWEYLHWDFDGTFLAGYEFSKLQGVGRKVRFVATYHNGFSLEGQFSRLRTSYYTVGIMYGF